MNESENQGAPAASPEATASSETPATAPVESPALPEQNTIHVTPVDRAAAKVARIVDRAAIAAARDNELAEQKAATPEKDARALYYPPRNKWGQSEPVACVVDVAHNFECCDLAWFDPVLDAQGAQVMNPDGSPRVVKRVIPSVILGGTRDTLPGQPGTFSLV